MVNFQIFFNMQDLEDGDTRDLSLKVVQKGTGAPLDDLDWIR